MLLSSLSLFTIILKVITASSGTISNDSSSISTDDIKSLKYTTKILAAQLEKWNNLFLTSLEPRMITTASLLARIESNVNNIQERAHVWDNFQLHVSAWNDQLASLDRKIDIISKGQEKMIALENKLNMLNTIDFKIDSVIKKINEIDEKNCKYDSLVGEFASRGILSTIKIVERKLDKLLVQHQNDANKINNINTTTLNVKCNTPEFVEELLTDVSSKVDIIFDKIYKRDGNFDNVTETEDYIGISEDDPNSLQKKGDMKVTNTNQTNRQCQKFGTKLEELLGTTMRIENMTTVVVDNFSKTFDNLYSELSNNKVSFVNIANKFEQNFKEFYNELETSLKSYFSEQRAHFESILTKKLPRGSSTTTTTLSPTQKPTFFDGSNKTKNEPNKKKCEDLDNDVESGVYVFEFHNKRYCEIRDNGLWTVIQRRDNYPVVQNFDRDWISYKIGFGDVSQDFWLGNDVISGITTGKEVILRIELEDFEGNFAWAEYSDFKVLPEDKKYQLLVSGYTGNASDSLASHNGSLFSTYDQKNDEAPACCPCAPSYGGGWWFNKCFECNLNGVYHRVPNENNYFRGIIWEHWLGNYSLKKSLMMVKTKGKVIPRITETKFDRKIVVEEP